MRAALAILALLSATPALAQRLPSTVTPTHYDLTIATDLAAATFDGEETIRVQIAAPTTAVVLNAAEIEFTDVSIVAGGRRQPAKVQLDAAKDQATFTVASPLAAGDAEIHVRYRGRLNNDLRGLYLSKANNRRYAVTQLEATDARRMFPCFDEPAFKATFTLTAIIDAADHAISNGAVEADSPGPAAGKHTVRFATTPRMSTYLLALAVGDFVCNAGSADDIPIRICSTPDKKGLTAFALESAQQIMRFYNRYYSIKYPFKKLDVVAVPDFSAGAMENTAAIFYRETLLLADEKASVGVRRSVAVVLAHEMAHQWFGDLVTMKWWDDIWLNEGFANWMETKPVAAWKPDWHMELSEAASNQTAMGLDALRSTRPIRASASTPDEINELFDPIAYEKGAAVLRMVEAWLGEDAFRKGVNDYLERFKYGNARAEDFWSTLAKSTGKPVDQVLPTFVDRPGVPLVDVDVKCQSGTATAVLTQQRYLIYGSPPAQSAVSPPWRIPVCLRTAPGKSVCELLDKQQETLPLSNCPSWAVGNAGARGYYRTALPPSMIEKLAADTSVLTPPERLGLVSDEWALVRAARHHIDTFMDLATGFGGERTAQVMTVLANTLTRIAEDILTGGPRELFRAWISSRWLPALQSIGWEPTPSDDDNTRALRATLIGLLGDTARNREVLAKARAVVQKELSSPGSVEPTLLNVLVNLAAIDGDAQLYEQYLARSRSAVDPEERYRYLFGLTNFTDPELARRTMAYTVGPDVRSQDTKLVIASLLGNDVARRIAWDMLRARWPEVQKKTGEFVGNTVIVSALGSFCDAQALGEVQSFFDTHKVPDAERTLQQTTERIGSCAALAAAERDRLVAWLTAHAPASPRAQ